jgi:hypothetical protein
MEAISKPQIRFKIETRGEEKAEHTRQYVSILSRLATRILGLRWGFEMLLKWASQYLDHLGVNKDRLPASIASDKEQLKHHDEPQRSVFWR